MIFYTFILYTTIVVFFTMTKVKLSKITDSTFVNAVYDKLSYNPKYNEFWMSNRVIPIIDVTRWVV